MAKNLEPELGIPHVEEEHNSGLSSALQHMAAGATAGIIENTAMYPVDTIKTRMQATAAGSTRYLGVMQSLRSIIQREGIGRVWSGVSAAAIGAGPSHAVYFAAYEFTKKKLVGDDAGHHPLATATAGALATVVEQGIVNPADVVKQRMQLEGHTYRGLVQAVRQIYAAEGLRAFWISYPTTLLMNVPYTAVHFATYESAKTFLASHFNHEPTHHHDHHHPDPHDDPHQHAPSSSPLIHLTAGAFAGALAAAVTNPLDVVKTRLQTQGFEVPGVGCCPTHSNTPSPSHSGGGHHHHNHDHHAASTSHTHTASHAAPAAAPKLVKYSGLVSALKTIWAEEGAAAFMKGIVPRVLFHAPAAAVCWTTYEFMKLLLGPDGAHDHGHHH